MDIKDASGANCEFDFFLAARWRKWPPVFFKRHDADSLLPSPPVAIIGDTFLKSHYSVFNYQAPGTGQPAVGFAVVAQ